LKNKDKYIKKYAKLINYYTILHLVSFDYNTL
jgi:hypothetical protein